MRIFVLFIVFLLLIFSAFAQSTETDCTTAGGEWTGKYCCIDDLSYNDPMPEYDPGFVAEPGVPRPVIGNKACVNGEAIENELDSSGEILAVDGLLYHCAISPGETDDKSGGPLTAEVVYCGEQGDYVCTHGYGFLSKFDQTFQNTLDYDEGEVISESTLSWDDTQKECCGGPSCYDGSSCLGEGQTIENDDTTYVCSKGSLITVPARKNWYDDPSESALGYCAEPYACVCAFGECDSTYITNGCTNTPGYYEDDHLCEPLYENDLYRESQWTTRTNLLATQLLTLATNDFTLHCDIPEYSLNNINLLPTRPGIVDELNNVCVIQYGDTVVMGVSLNDMNAFGSNSFVDSAIKPSLGGSVISSCN